MDTDWRAGIAQESRVKIVNRIMDTLQMHTPLSGQDGMTECRKIANRFEERTFYAASDKHDYLRRISLKILNLETRTQSAPNCGALPTSSTGTNQNFVRPLDSGMTQAQFRQQVAQPAAAGILNNAMQGSPGTQTSSVSNMSSLSQDSRNRIVNRIMDTLQRHTPLSGQDGVTELWKIANRMEEKIFYAASDQHDYLRRISLKMLNLEMRTQSAANGGALPTSSTGSNQI